MRILSFFFSLLFCVVVFGQTAIVVQTTSETAITPTASTGATDHVAGWTVTNPNGDMMLLIENTAGTGDGVVVITAQDPSVTVPGFGPLTKANISITVGINSQRLVGPFPKNSWNDSNGNVAGPAITGTGNGDIAISPFRFNPANL